MRRRLFKFLAIGLLGVLLAGGCAPSVKVEGEPLLAVFNGPAQNAVSGSAQAVHEHLAADPERGFALVSGFAMRFLESHTDLFLDRAPASAGRIARSQNADLAIMIGAPIRERTVTLSRDEASRRIDIELALEAQVVDPRTDAIVQTLRTRSHFGSRVEANDFPLPEPTDDGTLMTLVSEAARELALALKAELPYLFSQLLID